MEFSRDSTYITELIHKGVRWEPRQSVSASDFFPIGSCSYTQAASLWGPAFSQ